MSKELPFQPKGHCKDCKFSSPIPKKNHWKGEYYNLFCHRVPPTSATSHQDIWSQKPTVQDNDSCGMFERAYGTQPERHDLSSEFFIHSHWECSDSPTGHCVYTNYMYEDCIFCGGPEERK